MKRQKQSIARREQNRRAKSTVKTAIKRFKSAVEEKEAEKAATELNQVVKLIDTYAGKGLYHKNTAARKKSRLTALYNKLS
ncbi:MAG: 30S ribosomal protein S20 [Spirochaetia bacterium]|nr:30S ribosomal protein S20 [Spirochaetia bacterium]MCF7942669.1 30S ribosomal protein S20 [Spirochaetia bacterium]